MGMKWQHYGGFAWLGCLFGLPRLESFFEKDCCEVGNGALLSFGLRLKPLFQLGIDNNLNCGDCHNEAILLHVSKGCQVLF